MDPEQTEIEKQEASASAIFDGFVGRLEGKPPEKDDPEKPEGDKSPEKTEAPESSEKTNGKPPEKDDPEKPEGGKSPEKSEVVGKKELKEFEKALAASQKKEASLQQENDALKRSAKEKDAAVTIPPSKFVDSFKKDTSWKEFVAENPASAEPLEKFMSGIAKSVEDAMASNSAVTEELTKSVKESNDKLADDLITEAVPEWKSWLVTDDFSDWLEKQPQAVQNIAGTEGSVDDCIWLLNSFNDHMVSSGKFKTENSGKVPDNAGKVASINSKREKQLEAGLQTTATSAAAKKPGAEESTEALFDHFAAKKAG